MAAHTITCPVYQSPLGGNPSGGMSRRATIDNSRTTNENRQHWVNADSLSAVSQLTPQVRKTLRNRARYEVQNNSHAQGLVRTLVNDTVGRGPRLQMETNSDSLNAAVEQMWVDWTAAIDYPLKMRTLCGVRYPAGECFSVFRESKRLERMGLPVNLDIRLLEPDQIGDSWSSNWVVNPTGDDGIVCDEDGEVIAYKVMKHHPGDNRQFVGRWIIEEIPAENVVHWFVPERPGQLRGITPFSSALGIFAQLRRFTMATLTSAEIASMLSGVMLQDGTMGFSNQESILEENYATIDMVRGMLLTLPPGAKVEQFKPEQPTTNYDMFVNAKLREIGRCMNVPFGKMAGDHSSYNYSSGRLDDAPYWQDRDIERQALEAKVFNPIFYKWADFARFAIPQLAAFTGKPWELRHSWHYDARPSSDPVKDGNADEINLTNGSDTLTAIAARDGTTVDALLRERKRVIDMYKRYDLPLPPWATGAQSTVSLNTEPSTDNPDPADQPSKPGQKPNQKPQGEFANAS